MGSNGVLLICDDDVVRARWRMALACLGTPLSDLSSTDRTAIPEAAILVAGDWHGGASEALQLIRRYREKYPGARTVLIANDSSEEIVIAALRAGVNDYLKEPVSAETLMSSVRTLLSKANQITDRIRE